MIKNKLLRNIFFFVVLSVSSYAHGNAQYIEDGRIWLNQNMIGDLPVENWRWYTEVQMRLRNKGRYIDQFLIRTAVLYDLNDQTSLWLGYANVTYYPQDGEIFREHRIWQQILYNFKPICKINIQSRTRIEERFFENSRITGYRMRQMLRITIPSYISTGLLLVAFDEAFLYLNDTGYGLKPGFDQNRAFVGINFELNNNMSLEVGYLNQYIITQYINLMNHVLSGTLFVVF
jgi:hypothetical protein